MLAFWTRILGGRKQVIIVRQGEHTHLLLEHPGWEGARVLPTPPSSESHLSKRQRTLGLSKARLQILEKIKLSFE